MYNFYSIWVIVSIKNIMPFPVLIASHIESLWYESNQRSLQGNILPIPLVSVPVSRAVFNTTDKAWERLWLTLNGVFKDIPCHDQFMQLYICSWRVTWITDIAFSYSIIVAIKVFSRTIDWSKITTMHRIPMMVNSSLQVKFVRAQETLYSTRLLKLLDKMYKYQMDPTKTVRATERTRDAGRTDGRSETNIHPNDFVVWGYNNHINDD